MLLPCPHTAPTAFSLTPDSNPRFHPNPKRCDPDLKPYTLLRDQGSGFGFGWKGLGVGVRRARSEWALLGFKSG